MDAFSSPAASVRLVATADHRLALAEPGQLPHAGAAWILVGRDVGVDEIRLAAGNSGAHRVGESGGALHADAVDAGRARHGGEIGIVGCAGLRMLEVGRELAPVEVAALQSADRGVGVVVPHHPYG